VENQLTHYRTGGSVLIKLGHYGADASLEAPSGFMLNFLRPMFLIRFRWSQKILASRDAVRQAFPGA